eukprot:6189055-Pleurochrysis_carterae.AAC.3
MHATRRGSQGGGLRGFVLAGPVRGCAGGHACMGHCMPRVRPELARVRVADAGRVREGGRAV